MQEENEPIIGDDPASKKRRMTKADEKTFFTWSVVATVVLGISAAIAAIIELASSATFSLALTATSDYRTGAKNDNYPQGPLLAAVGSTNLPWIAVFVSILSFIGFFILSAANGKVVEQMQLGASPYLWFTATLWHFIVFMEIAFFAGITNVYHLVFVSLAAITWLWFFWLNDLLQAPAYIQYGKQSGTKMQMGWQWLPWFFGFFVAIVVYVVIIIYLVQTFFTATNSPTTGFFLVPFIGLLLYLAVPIVVILRYFDWGFKDTYGRDLFLVIYTFIFALIMTWLPLIVSTFTP
jgi:hypothetical protein